MQIYICTCVCHAHLGVGRGDTQTGYESVQRWPLQDIRLLRVVCARINRPFITPSTCIAHTVAILLPDFWALPNLLDHPVECHTPYKIGNSHIV